MGARDVLGRRPHRARRLAAVRRLLQARPGGRSGRALHDRRPTRPGRGRRRAGRPAARLRARRRTAEPDGAAAADRGLLAGRQPAGGRAHRARLGARGHRPPDPRAFRQSHLRGHGSGRPGGRGGRPRRQSRARRRHRRGSGWAGCGCASTTAPERSARWSARGWWAPRWTACSTWRSPTTWPATSAPRSPRPMRPRRSIPAPSGPGRPTPTRWPAPTAWPSAPQACRKALKLGKDDEVSQLLARVEAATPRGLSERSAAA